jgi:hypothetical protein
MLLRTALAALAGALLLTPAALASGSATPNEIGLAKSLKVNMQRAYTTKAPGTKFTTVTCKISTDMTSARCVARFTRTAHNLKGAYQVTVTSDASGNANWRATSVACTSLKTGAKVKC